MFRSTSLRTLHKGLVSKVAGFDAKGRAHFSEPKEVGFCFVKYNRAIKTTSIRSDKSGSKSRAEESHFDARIMVDPKASVELSDKFEFFGDVYRIVKIHPRYDMTGSLHHNEMDLAIWE